MSPCVIGVSATAALLWASGEASDRDVLLRAPLKPEAVFVVHLPPGAYVPCARLIANLKKRGAVCLIARAGPGPVADHLLKAGGLVLHTEPGPMFRIFCPPAAFAKWVPSVTRRGPA